MSTAAPVPSPAATAERKGDRTRRRILEASRSVFAEVGYERATIRGIAVAAGVDKSSVIKYFGTKQALFREAVHWEIPVAEMTCDDPAQTIDNYARSMLTAWTADLNSPMAVLLRTAMTSADAAEILRRHITVEAVGAVAETIADVPDARLRASLMSAMLMGIATQRFLLQMPDLVDADVDDILHLVAPLLEQLIHSD